MKLVKPSVEFLDVTTDPLKSIELAGRTCYKSEDKITEDSAEKFVDMLVKRGHHAMIEHSNFILSVNSLIYDYILALPERQYIRLSCDLQGNGTMISGNPRAFRDLCMRPDVGSGIQRMLAVELSKKAQVLFDDVLRYTNHLAYLDTDALGTVELFESVESLSQWERVLHDVASYRIICDRGVTHEIVRHRPFSYAQESTRYVNYKEGVEFILPCWMMLHEGQYTVEDGDHYFNGEYVGPTEQCEDTAWLESMCDAEAAYQLLVTREDWIPQQARSVLPNSLKTEIVVTGNLQEWKHFFKLRCNKKAHPQIQEVANMVLADMQQRVPVIFDDVS